MISRKTTLSLAEFMSSQFWTERRVARGDSFSKRVNVQGLYEFLYVHEYHSGLCSLAQKSLRNSPPGDLKDFVLKLHTGETLYTLTDDWTYQQRQQSGQSLLLRLAGDVLNQWYQEWQYTYHIRKDRAQLITHLMANLELDGYVYRDSRLVESETEVVNTEEHKGIIQTRYHSLQLANEEIAFHHLVLIGDHYVDGKYDDSIGNARKFMECVLQEIADAHSRRAHGKPLEENVYSWASKVRIYLQKEGLMSDQEIGAIKELHALLSETGSHPYIAPKDVAIMARSLSLIMSQFALLRFEGWLEANPSLQATTGTK